MGNNLENKTTRNLICEQVTLPIINPPNDNAVEYNLHYIAYFRYVCTYLTYLSF